MLELVAFAISVSGPVEVLRVRREAEWNAGKHGSELGLPGGAAREVGMQVLHTEPGGGPGQDRRVEELRPRALGAAPSDECQGACVAGR